MTFDRALVRTLLKELRRDSATVATKPDWWSRASTISSFFGSVVIAAASLLISSSIQKAQLAATAASNHAQIELARLKNENDRHVQEGQFAATLLQHLLSDEPKHRELAVVMLRRTVPTPMFEELIGIIAAKDPDPAVRDAAIKQLGASQNPSVAISLSKISEDKARPQAERGLARETSTVVAFAGGLSQGGCLFMASEPGALTEEISGQEGIFSQTLIAAFDGGLSPATLTPNGLTHYLTSVVLMSTLARQRPFSTCDLSSSDEPLLASGRPTRAVIVGLSSFKTQGVRSLRGSSVNAERLATTLRKKRVPTQLLTNENATKAAVISALIQLVTDNFKDETSDVIFYYGGFSWSMGGRAYLATYDTKIDSGNAETAADSSIDVQTLRRTLEPLTKSRKFIFIDASSRNPFAASVDATR